MDWACTTDRGPLEPQRDTLICRACRTEFECFDGTPSFAHGPGETAAAQRRVEDLEEFLALIAEHGYERAAREFSDRHACSLRRFTTDWTYFVPLEQDDRVLELGAGCGDDTLFLSRRVAEVVSVVPTIQNAEILRRRMEEAGVENVSVAVLRDLRRLPLADGVVSALAIDDVSAGALGLTGDKLAAAAAEWRRVLAPGGTAVIRHANRGVGRLASMLMSGASRAPIDHHVKLAVQAEGARVPGRRNLVRAMRSAGFSPPETLAPLPGVGEIGIVLPVEHGDVVRYCFDRLLRRNSPVNRMIIAAATLGVRLRLVPNLVPYYFLVFETAA